MTQAQLQELGSVISIAKGRKHSELESSSPGGKRLIGIDDLRNDDVIRRTGDKRGVEATPSDVLIAWDGANAGTVGFGKSGYIGSTIARLRIRPGVRLNTAFLALFLRSKLLYLRRTATGATIPHISRSALERIQLPGLDLNDQIRVAYLLGKVDGLITQRKQHLQQLDGLLKSVFMEMFGPQAAGYVDWPLVEIKDLAANHKGAMRTGPFGSNLLHSEFEAEGDVAVIGIDNAAQNHFVWGERRFVSNEKYKELASYRVFPGDVIVTIMGTIGRSAVVPDDIPLAINTKHLAAITLNRELANPLFLSYSIHSSPFILNQFRNKNRGAIMSGLNLGLIKETKLKRPPIHLQNKFAKVYAHVDGLKILYKKTVADLESLYDVLSHRAFRGELDFSRVPLIITADEKIELSAEAGADSTMIADLDSAAISTSEGRKRLLQQSFTKWLENRGGLTASTMADFWQAARIESLDYSDDGSDATGYSLDDYDELKKWIFGRIAQGRFSQTLNTNIVPGDEARSGSEIVLRKSK